MMRASWWWVVLSVLGLAPGWARAATCSFTSSSTTGTYLVSVRATMVNDPNIAVGSVLHTSTPTVISPSVTFDCKGQSNYLGLETPAGSPLPAGTDTFDTGIAGVGYRVRQNGAYVFAYPGLPLANQASYTADPVTIELVKTGPITDGSFLQGSLAQFKAGTTNNYINYGVITLANRLTFIAPTCQVSTTNVTVTLPTVTTSAFGGIGSTSGITPFQIGLSCSSGATVRITLDTTTPVAGQPGVIAPSSGSASGLGVQLLDSSGTAPVQFGVAQTIGATPDGALSVSYYARYYQIASAVSAGLLGATATFTLSYE